MIDEPKRNVKVKIYTSPAKTPDVPQGRDTFETPNYAIDLLIPFIPKHVKHVWECSCGRGKIASRLKHHGYKVFSSDIRENPGVDEVLNYVTDFPTKMLEMEFYIVDCVITNPPFSIKDMFIDRALSFNMPFAFLINADYSGMQIDWIKRGCEKIIPNRRIDYITPTGRQGKTSASQFHSMWLTYGFDLGRTETFVDLPLIEKKENI